MAAILVYQNNETAAMLVYQTNHTGVKLFSYVKTLFCSIAAGDVSENDLYLTFSVVMFVTVQGG